MPQHKSLPHLTLCLKKWMYFLELVAEQMGLACICGRSSKSNTKPTSVHVEIKRYRYVGALLGMTLLVLGEPISPQLELQTECAAMAVAKAKMNLMLGIW